MIETPEPPHLPKLDAAKDKPTHWFEIGLTLVVVLISACSLYVAWHTSHTMEALVAQNARLVKAQSTPILEYNHGNGFEQKQIRAFMRNAGTGPARIVWVRFEIDGKSYGHWKDMMNERYPFTRKNVTTSSLKNTLMAAGEQRFFFYFDYDPTDPERVAAWEGINRDRYSVTAEACYCSVFEECWTSSLDGDVPTPVQSCDAEPGLTTQAAAPRPDPPAGGPAH